MTLVVVHERDAWYVWATLEGEHPETDAFGFIIGEGPTRPVAIDLARIALLDGLHRLEQAQYAHTDAPRVRL